MVAGGGRMVTVFFAELGRGGGEMQEFVNLFIVLIFFFFRVTFCGGMYINRFQKGKMEERLHRILPVFKLLFSSI